MTNTPTQTRFFLSVHETNQLVDLYNAQARLYHRMCAEPDIAKVRAMAVERDIIGEQINLLLTSEVHYA